LTGLAEDYWTDSFTIEQDGVLHVSASGKSTYRGDKNNAGIYVNVIIDGKSLCRDFSFEGESSNITFFASCSTDVILKKGKHTIEVKLDKARDVGNTYFNSELTISAVALRL